MERMERVLRDGACRRENFPSWTLGASWVHRAQWPLTVGSMPVGEELETEAEGDSHQTLSHVQREQRRSVSSWQLATGVGVGGSDFRNGTLCLAGDIGNERLVRFHVSGTSA